MHFLSRFSCGLKWNLRKDVWNKIWNFVKFIHVWFTCLFICNEQFPKSARSYCILYVIQKIFLKCNLRKDVWNFVIFIHVWFCLSATNISQVCQELLHIMCNKHK
ncbi:hypothetical protein ALC57_04911 [Trachymyrmex cornetzi]|uniref:Uncharacterized protein n=1 Tax=Trachymyrmex cornetzi TaxID=471704 RepID=A0A151JCJ7_9HYME|nr:hypothetical protein ALC57_04910 [Trachymyrmex cornetzi]KYN22685.1 hypothetical protein ALC57_04911 [Trachymyrmex cornetzi]